MAHTPGPWMRQGLIITDGNGVIIADCRLRSPSSAFEDWQSNVGKRSVEEHEDNARLVEASPDLLEALTELAELMQDVMDGIYEPDSFTLQPARAAIAKARGETE